MFRELPNPLSELPNLYLVPHPRPGSRRTDPMDQRLKFAQRPLPNSGRLQNVHRPNAKRLRYRQRVRSCPRLPPQITCRRVQLLRPRGPRKAIHASYPSRIGDWMNFRRVRNSWQPRANHRNARWRSRVKSLAVGGPWHPIRIPVKPQPSCAESTVKDLSEVACSCAMNA